MSGEMTKRCGDTRIKLILYFVPLICIYIMTENLFCNSFFIFLFLFFSFYWIPITKYCKSKFTYRIRTSYYPLAIISFEGVKLLQGSLHAQDIPIWHSSHVHDDEIMRTKQLIKKRSLDKVRIGEKRRCEAEDSFDAVILWNT